MLCLLKCVFKWEAEYYNRFLNCIDVSFMSHWGAVSNEQSRPVMQYVAYISIISIFAEPTTSSDIFVLGLRLEQIAATYNAQKTSSITA